MRRILPILLALVLATQTIASAQQQSGQMNMVNTFGKPAGTCKTTECSCDFYRVYWDLNGVRDGEGDDFKTKAAAEAQAESWRNILAPEVPESPVCGVIGAEQGPTTDQPNLDEVQLLGRNLVNQYKSALAELTGILYRVQNLNILNMGDNPFSGRGSTVADYKNALFLAATKLDELERILNTSTNISAIQNAIYQFQKADAEAVSVRNALPQTVESEVTFGVPPDQACRMGSLPDPLTGKFFSCSGGGGSVPIVSSQMPTTDAEFDQQLSSAQTEENSWTATQTMLQSLVSSPDLQKPVPIVAALVLDIQDFLQTENSVRRQLSSLQDQRANHLGYSSLSASYQNLVTTMANGLRSQLRLNANPSFAATAYAVAYAQPFLASTSVPQQDLAKEIDSILGNLPSLNGISMPQTQSPATPESSFPPVVLEQPTPYGSSNTLAQADVSAPSPAIALPDVITPPSGLAACLQVTMQNSGGYTKSGQAFNFTNVCAQPLYLSSCLKVQGGSDKCLFDWLAAPQTPFNRYGSPDAFLDEPQWFYVCPASHEYAIDASRGENRTGLLHGSAAPLRYLCTRLNPR